MASASSSIRAEAPAKAILLGEHFVVYGAPGLACAIEPPNQVELAILPGGAPGLEYATALGTLQARPPAPSAGPKASASAISVEGPEALRPAAEAYRMALAERPELAALSLRAKVVSAWPLKGVGNSASLAAALSAALLCAAGEKKPGPQRLFPFAQAADTAAHGGVPSGIDASAVCRGGCILYEKSFDPALPHRLEPVPLALPKGWSFLLVDTLRPGQTQATTAAQISAFAASLALSKKPADMTAAERQAVCSQYIAHVFLPAQAALEAGDMPALGVALDSNQRLLENRGVSCPDIDKAVRLARIAGAAGAKLSGAGGTGGLVIALVSDAKKAAVRQRLEADGMKVFDLALAKKGAHPIAP